jgi:hypothetical protein
MTAALVNEKVWQQKRGKFGINKVKGQGFSALKFMQRFTSLRQGFHLRQDFDGQDGEQEVHSSRFTVEKTEDGRRTDDRR